MIKESSSLLKAMTGAMGWISSINRFSLARLQRENAHRCHARGCGRDAEVWLSVYSRSINRSSY